MPSTSRSLLLSHHHKTLSRILESNLHQLRREDLYFHTSHPERATTLALSHLRSVRAQWKAELIGRTEDAILLGEEYIEDFHRDIRVEERERMTGVREGWTVLVGRGRRVDGEEGWRRLCGPSPASMVEAGEMRELEEGLRELRVLRRRLEKWRPMSFWDVGRRGGKEYDGEVEVVGGVRMERLERRASFAAELVRSNGRGYNRWDGRDGHRHYDDNGLEEEKRSAQRAWAARMERGEERNRDTFYPPPGRRIRLDEIVYWPREENDFD